MPVVETAVATERASRYLQQLCKHFAHKISVDFDASRGKADFSFGICTMIASDKVLELRCEASTQEALDRVQYIVDDHVKRFTWKEKPQIDWLSPAAPA